VTPKFPPCSGNADGPFYVVEQGCASCEAPLAEAPDLMELAQVGDHPHCRFRRQPQTEDELSRAIRAIRVCCTGALRYAGHDKTVLDRIGEPTACDVMPVGIDDYSI
jgi:hypothetical protein